MALVKKKERADLSITALYTSYSWQTAGFVGADLLATEEARVVFRVTNWALGVVRFFRPSIPSLFHSLVQRHALVDRAVLDAGAKQVLEIAAGLSRRGVAMSADPDVTYVEVDLGPVVDRKKELLARSELGKAALARTNLRFVAGDARTLDFGELVDTNARVTVVAEGLLMYLKADEQRAFFAKVASLMKAGGTFVFDLVPFVEQPKPGFLGRSLEAGLKLFTRGKSLELDERTRDDLASELREAGFTRVELYEPTRAPAGLELPHQEQRTQTLVFVCAI